MTTRIKASPLKRAAFEFEDAGQPIMVTFEDGRVTVIYRGKMYVTANPYRRWGGRVYKPCVTHALNVVEQMLKDG